MNRSSRVNSLFHPAAATMLTSLLFPHTACGSELPGTFSVIERTWLFEGAAGLTALLALSRLVWRRCVSPAAALGIFLFLVGVHVLLVGFRVRDERFLEGITPVELVGALLVVVGAGLAAILR